MINKTTPNFHILMYVCLERFDKHSKLFIASNGTLAAGFIITVYFWYHYTLLINTITTTKPA